METKELKIVPPEGYEIDKENSTFKRIVFKKKCDDRPRSWEEFCKRGFTGEEWHIQPYGAQKSSRKKGEPRCVDYVGFVDNVKEAEAFVALMQLRQLRNAWVGDWEPKWEDNNYKYGIEVYVDDIQVYKYNFTNKCLSFPTKEMAEEFYECFKDLLETAKILL